MRAIGTWQPTAAPPLFDPPALCQATHRLREPVHVLFDPRTGRVGAGFEGRVEVPPGEVALARLATLPPLYPEWLGDRSFLEVHGLRFPYVAGAMANGIATTDLVIAMAKGGCLGFFGAAGLDPEHIEAALVTLRRALGGAPQGELEDAPGPSWGSNLIHAPNEPDIEALTADLYIRFGVKRVSASAYMKLTAPLVRYAASGLRVLPSGAIHREHFVFAKISRPEVARRFLEPPPEAMLRALVEARLLSEGEARLAAQLPVAEDITVEADSGGHTDNQALSALFPTILTLRDEIAQARGYTRPIRVGAAGGLGTPTAVAGAFALGASYVLTGSVNQSALESGLHPEGKAMLAQATLSDVVMAPAADMFELGVEVQVLSRGTMFGIRAKRLYHLYRTHASLEAIPPEERARLEKEILGSSLEDAWAATRAFWQGRDPREITRAEADPKHKMALTFRAYLGQSSKWAIRGESHRRADYQIWCGPAMGAFNAWVKGSFLEDVRARSALQIALNLMEGAATATRAQQLRSFGVPMPPAAFAYTPRPLSL